MAISAEKVLEELFKHRFTQLKEDSEYSTQAISQTTRIVALGLAALALPYLTSEEGKLSPLLLHQPGIVVFVAMIGGLAVVADLGQNVISDYVSRQEMLRLVRNLKKNNLSVTSPSEFMSSGPTKLTKAREYFYWAKVGLVSLGVFIMLVLLSVWRPVV